MSDAVITPRMQSDGVLATAGTSEPVRSEKSPIYEALVVDAILDHRHPKYSRVDGYNIGAIKVRIFEVTQRMDEEFLPWADPYDTTLLEIPLFGEIVNLFKVRGNWFYTKKIPIASRIQENAMVNMNKELNNRPTRLLSNQLSRVMSGTSELTNEVHQFGTYFRPDSRVRPLIHFEGDTVFQGRMGHSIRFGSSVMDPKSDGMAPNIIIRTGQGKDLENDRTSIDAIFGITAEDLNKDATSIWMVSDQTIPLLPSTTDAGSFYRSILNPPNKFDKASITLNSDKLFLNSKKGHIMMFSNEEIYINSCTRTSIDSDENIILSAFQDIQLKSTRNVDNISDADFTVKAGDEVSILGVEKISLISKKIHLGNAGDDVEPVVGGTSLAIFLARLIAVLMGPGAVPPQIPYQSIGSPIPTTVPPPPAPGPANFSHVITPLGPGLLSPAILSGLLTLYTELVSPNPGSRRSLPFSGAVFNSQDTFVSLAHQDPDLGFEPNEFEKGEQIESENSEWNLNGPYYRVE